MASEGRSTDELILMLLTGAGTIAVLPFAIMRFMQGSWPLFFLDTALVTGLSALTTYVYLTGRIALARYAVATLCVAAILGTVYVAGTQQLTWTFPAVLIIFYLLPPVHALGISLLTFSALLPQFVTTLEPAQLMTTLFTIALTVAFSFAFSSQKEAQRITLQNVATKDPLTGAENRRGLGKRLKGLIARNQRTPVKVSLILLDLDNFKRINDEYGHAAGDDVLIGVVNVLRQRVRTSDSIYRIGGEEFLIIADSACEGTAHAMAEDLRVLIEATRLVKDYPVTVSIGIAQLVAGEDYDSWIKRADDALYEAKRKGRNRVVHALADGTLSSGVPAATTSPAQTARLVS
ncbi:MAG: GGDEF domain-containing protein [Pseudomonadota bacterium]